MESEFRVESKRKRVANGKYARPYRCARRDFPPGCGPLAGLSLTASTNLRQREAPPQVAETIAIVGPECSGSSSDTNSDKIWDLEEEVCSNLEVMSDKQAYIPSEEKIALKLRDFESNAIRTSNPKDVQGKGDILIGIREGRSLQSKPDKSQDSQEEVASSPMEVLSHNQALVSLKEDGPFNLRDRSQQEVVPHDLNIQTPTTIVPSDSELPSQISIRTAPRVIHPIGSIGISSDASGIKVKVAKVKLAWPYRYAKREFPDGCGRPGSISMEASTKLSPEEAVPPIAESIAIAGTESSEGLLERNPQKSQDKQEKVSSDMEVSSQEQPCMFSKEEVPLASSGSSHQENVTRDLNAQTPKKIVYFDSELLRRNSMRTVIQVSCHPRWIPAVRSFPEGCGRQAASGCAEVKSNSADTEASRSDVQRKGDILHVSSSVEEVLPQKEAFKSTEEVAFNSKDASHHEVVPHDLNVQMPTTINPFDSELPSQKATALVDFEVLTPKAMDPLELESPTQKHIVLGLMASMACPVAGRQIERVRRRPQEVGIGRDNK